ncbi:MFS transporter [Nostoc sp. CHAB 5844]|nr:MFS transporter [Nostoc sp. CHAB 5844]
MKFHRVWQSLLCDRFGRKPLLIISLAGTLITHAIAGTATTASWLFFAKCLDGITGGNASVAQAIIFDVTAPENRAKASAVFFGGCFFSFRCDRTCSTVN